MGTTIHPDTERLRLYDEQVRRMVADPDMRGPVLAVGLALAWIYRDHGPVKTTIRRIAELARLGRVAACDQQAVRDVVFFDAPRYEVNPPRVSQCEAPMIRRTGLCGKDGGALLFSSLNWEDGTRVMHAFCHRHRQVGVKLSRELEERDLRLRAERGDPPRPPANVGGLLQRHFPGVDWEPLYTWARPGWKPPERVPASYSTPLPALQLIAGNEEPEHAVGEPPALTVVHGMPDRLASGRRPRPPRRPRPL